MTKIGYKVVFCLDAHRFGVLVNLLICSSTSKNRKENTIHGQTKRHQTSETTSKLPQPHKGASNRVFKGTQVLRRAYMADSEKSLPGQMTVVQIQSQVCHVNANYTKTPAAHLRAGVLHVYLYQLNIYLHKQPFNNCLHISSISFSFQFFHKRTHKHA